MDQTGSIYIAGVIRESAYKIGGSKSPARLLYKLRETYGERDLKILHEIAVPNMERAVAVLHGQYADHLYNGLFVLDAFDLQRVVASGFPIGENKFPIGENEAKPMEQAGGLARMLGVEPRAWSEGAREIVDRFYQIRGSDPGWANSPRLPSPRSTLLATAEGWLAEGFEAPFVIELIATESAKLLTRQETQDLPKEPPWSLRFFDASLRGVKRDPTNRPNYAPGDGTAAWYIKGGHYVDEYGKAMPLTEQAWKGRLEAYAVRGAWDDVKLGPPPGLPGCVVPRHLIQAHLK